jgi:predicted glycogen debranching enzyme
MSYIHSCDKSVRRYHSGTSDGLLYAGQEGVQLTWMDAKVGNWVVTPRIGKPIEVNALWYNAFRPMEVIGEREILGGQAAFLACARGRKSGYQRRKVFSHSSSSTRVLICRRRCAPRWLHPICCFFTIRLLTT